MATVEAGGEFGLRFTNLDEESLEHLQSILASKVSLEPGAKESNSTSKGSARQ